MRLCFDDLTLGTTWLTQGRTLLECDLAGFVNLSWSTKDLLADQHQRECNVICERPVLAMMLTVFAEEFALSLMNRIGLAFLNVNVDARRQI